MVSMRGYMGVLLFLTAAMSFATGVPWKVAADGDFSTGMNWLGDAVPDANQTVVFTNKAASAYKVTLSENVTNESFSMGTDRVVLDLNGNNYTFLNAVKHQNFALAGTDAGAFVITNSDVAVTNTLTSGKRMRLGYQVLESPDVSPVNSHLGSIDLTISGASRQWCAFRCSQYVWWTS